MTGSRLSGGPPAAERRDGPPAFVERRSQDRQRTVLVNAAVRHGGREGLCRIQGISTAGLQIRTSLPMTPQMPAQIVLRSGRSVHCLVRWSANGEAGMTHDVGDALSHMLTEGVGEGRAALRFRTERPVTVVIRKQSCAATLAHLSPGELWLRGLDRADKGEPVLVTIPGLGDLVGHVVGDDDDSILVRLNAAIAFRELDPWLAVSKP